MEVTMLRYDVQWLDVSSGQPASRHLDTALESAAFVAGLQAAGAHGAHVASVVLLEAAESAADDEETG
jgi:hypothetical protein